MSLTYHFVPSVYDELMKASGCHDYVILGVFMGREESLWSMASVRDRERGFMAELEHRFIARESLYWKVGHVVTVEHRRAQAHTILCNQCSVFMLPCYLVPSSHVRLLVITMTIFLHAFRSFAELHSSVSVRFVTAFVSSSQCALSCAATHS